MRIDLWEGLSSRVERTQFRSYETDTLWVLPRIFLIVFAFFLLSSCIQEAKWTFTGDTPGAPEDSTQADGTGEVLPSDAPTPQDAVDMVEPQDTIEPQDMVDPQDTIDPEDTPDPEDAPDPEDTLDPEDTPDTIDTDICVPDCDQKDCGDDDCGGTCGECAGGTLCEGSWNCQDDLCVLTDPLICNDGNPCTNDVCDDEAAGCVYTLKPLEDLVVTDCPCDADEACEPLEDGDLCNGTLVCDLEAGTPTCAVDPDTVVECSELPDGSHPDCNVPACVPETGLCTIVQINPDQDCDDWDLCTEGEICDGGLCVGGTPVSCDDGNECTEDLCNSAAGCHYVDLGDGIECPDEGGVCFDGSCCVPACGGKECGDDGCGGSCGECTGGTPCGGSWTCQDDVCVLTNPPDCDDGNDCTEDSCEPGDGCQHVPLWGQPCDDGEFCSTGDNCKGPDGTLCEGDGWQDCDDDNPCTSDQCIDGGIGCYNSGTDDPCEDGNPCTVGDQCSEEACVPGGPADCEDGNDCTEDSCSPAEGCGHVDLDGPACAGGAGTCISGGCCIPDCTDKPCGDDGCGGSCGSCTEGHECVGDVCVGQCDDSNGVDWDGCNAGVLAEAVANQYWESNQQFPAVGVTPGDHFIVSWSSDGQEGDNMEAGVYMRVFQNNGEPLPEEIHVNVNQDGNQNAPALPVTLECLAPVAWADNYGSSGYRIQSRVFDNGGSPTGVYPDGYCVSCEYSVGGQSDPAVTCLGGVWIATAWGGHGAGDSNGIFATLHHATYSGEQFRVNQSTDNSIQSNPDIAKIDDSGSFVVVWHSWGAEDGDGACIQGRIFNNNGVPAGDEFIVNSTNESNQMHPAVADLTDSRFVVVWNGLGPGDDDEGIFAQIYSSAGLAVGSEFRVNGDVSGQQHLADVAGLENGGFVVVWQSPDAQGQAGIFGRLFNSDGIPVTDDISMNVSMMNNQEEPQVASLDDDRFIVTWQSSASEDGEGYSVMYRCFDMQGEPLYLCNPCGNGICEPGETTVGCNIDCNS